MPFLCQNPECCTCMHFRPLISVLGCSNFYFLETVMPVRNIGIPDANKNVDWYGVHEVSICHHFVKKVNRKIQELTNVLMFFLISISMCCNSAFCFLELIILISKVGYPESKQGVETVTLSSMGTICLPYSIILKFYIFPYLRYYFR